jgi:hypothetical protein
MVAVAAVQAKQVMHKVWAVQEAVEMVAYKTAQALHQVQQTQEAVAVVLMLQMDCHQVTAVLELSY